MAFRRHNREASHRSLRQQLRALLYVVVDRRKEVVFVGHNTHDQLTVEALHRHVAQVLLFLLAVAAHDVLQVDVDDEQSHA